MSTDKPLHVQVAEALGWKEILFAPDPKSLWDDRAIFESMVGCGYTHQDPSGQVRTIPHYDTDWSATGPLIERHSINISRNSRLGSGPAWRAVWDDDSSFNVVADSPLEAVCRLILALKAAGKLDA